MGIGSNHRPNGGHMRLLYGWKAFLHVGMNERVVWFLALPASTEATALPREVARPQTVQAQAIRPNGGNHPVMWQ